MGDSPCSSRSGSPCLANGRESPDSSPVARRPPPGARSRSVRKKPAAPVAATPRGTSGGPKAAKQAKQSHEASPSVGPSQAPELPPELPRSDHHRPGQSPERSPDLPPGIGAPGRLPVPVEVPERPPDFRTDQLVSAQAGIGADESYSKDEEALNTFLKLHPMLR